MRIFLGFFFSLVLLSSFGQKPGAQLSLKIGGKYQPTNFLWQGESLPDNWREQYDFWPILQADLGLRQSFGRSNWFWETAVSYRHTRQVFHFKVPDEIDPFYGFVYENSEEGSFSDVINQFGLKAGAGYRWLSQNRKHALVLPAGVQGHAPLFSKTVSKINDKRSENPTYQGKDFKNGIYYGLYLAPAYEFSLASRSRWRFSLFAEGDLLIHNNSESNPVMLWGGGLGVAYRLGR